jgi:hypothetical protein
MVGQQKICPSSFSAVVGSGIDKNKDTGSGINIRIRNTGSVSMYFTEIRTRTKCFCNKNYKKFTAENGLYLKRFTAENRSSGEL